MTGLRLENQATEHNVGRCGQGCGRPAAYMVVASADGHSAFTFSCGRCLNLSRGRALHMLADSMLELARDDASR